MCYEKSLNPPFVSSKPYVVYPRIKRSLQYLPAMICISVMVWTFFYPGNRLHAVSLKVGLVMDDFGGHDRSYNQLAYQGLVQAEKNWESGEVPSLQQRKKITRKSLDVMFKEVMNW